MRISITHKLFLAISLAAAVAVISLVLAMQWSMKQGFLRYLNTIEKTGVSRLAASLEEGYRRESGWGFVLHHPAMWQRLIMTSIPEGGMPPPPGPPPELLAGPAANLPPPLGMDEKAPHRPLPPRLLHHFEQRFFLLDAGGKVLISRLEIPAHSEATPLRNQGKVIGYLGILPRTEISEPHQERFLKEQTMAFAIVAGIVLLLASWLSALLSKRLVRPLQNLAGATRLLAAGKFTTRVEVVSADELGQLAGNFNTLAMTLEKNEQARRQWVADISHELRTPVAILRGEIEALQDGIRQPDQHSLSSLHGEVLRLARLVEDLYQLTMSDLGALTYRKKNLDIIALLKEIVVIHAAQFTEKGLSLTNTVPAENAVEVFGDAERLRQLFTNLLDNSLKYTNAGGALRIDMTCHERTVRIDFQDSAPGVAGADMERLFERLYRVDASRNRETGGAGLGLAICRNIVEAHLGKISVQPSPLGGLWVQVELPRTNP
ncbi:ATP-binding protein [Thiovibrio frasassiensis]|uniref:histidine kinase n=1 Tax=Thiovibrio frasassiensis TaxID=2984131 RepID=A0A9X4RPF3_9BACT|nr:ATP-binding protein [Thiovibrio frasassiensis]MDG4475192.1 ATP-binding protein [Thiovibrio frasassiensis]